RPNNSRSGATMAVVFFKSRVKGYFRKDGVFVPEHQTKVVAKPKPAVIKPAKKATTAQWPGWNTKQPLDLGDTAPVTAVPAAPAKTAKTAKTADKTGWPYPAPTGKTTHKPSPKLTGGSQGSFFSKPSWPNAVTHPQRGEDGKPFKVNEPSSPSAPATWTDPAAVAVFVPAGETPASLNGVAFAPWTDHPKTDEGWAFVPGQMPDLEEPDMETKGKAPAAGVVVEEPDGRVWMVKPSNAFAGYVTTFPKGHADEGHSLQATAIKEAFEESGLQVEITGFIGDVERGQTMTRYYRARRVGGTPSAMGWETQAAVLAPRADVHGELNRSVDRGVATLAGIKSPAGLLDTADDWEKTGKAAGSNPGGFFTDPDGVPWYVKVPKSTAIAKNEVLASKLYEAAGVAVPELKHVTLGGKTGIASRVVPGLKKIKGDAQSIGGVMDGFAVDAWLANWDVVGLEHDNLLEDPHGNAMRVDVGGSLLFRAQGAPKGKAFGDEVGELDTLTSGKNPQSASVFGGITHDELQAGIARVAAVTPEEISALCAKYGPGTQEERKRLAQTLIARRAYLMGLQG
ncbi:NUDIX hydrolase, partial [Paraburkholderia sp. MM6662-R1]|uniref:NUDIX hydrolase n=1 Tax=Paraburkholderia sp. MM6662-R1 TaxID=2991066 RepID=UPI003D1D831D